MPFPQNIGWVLGMVSRVLANTLSNPQFFLGKTAFGKMCFGTAHLVKTRSAKK